MENSIPVSFLAYWELNDFIFIEYMGKGYGTLLINTVKNIGKKVVFEVEPPINEVCNKRIKYYEKLDFHKYESFYLQPPLNNENKWVELKMMTYPLPINSNVEFLNLAWNLYSKIYAVNKEKFNEVFKL